LTLRGILLLGRTDFITDSKSHKQLLHVECDFTQSYSTALQWFHNYSPTLK